MILNNPKGKYMLHKAFNCLKTFTISVCAFAPMAMGGTSSIGGVPQGPMSNVVLVIKHDPGLMPHPTRNTVTVYTTGTVVSETTRLDGTLVSSRTVARLSLQVIQTMQTQAADV